MNGETPFAEVFFNDVRVPVANRLGNEGQGWEVTKHALANERSSIAEVTAMVHHLEDLKDLAKRCRRDGRPALIEVFRRLFDRSRQSIERRQRAAQVT